MQMKIPNLSFSIVLFVILVLWLSLNLNSQAQVYNSHKVKYLPGFDGPLPFSLETGYIGVDEGDETQLFYYFFESENNSKEDPIVLWLPGGPMCSGMSAILYEMGPIMLEETHNHTTFPKVILREYSWTKSASMIFLDFPAGAGFSYGKTSRANYTGDYKSSHNINEFLRKWLLNHPQFHSNHLYLGGDSYTGFILPLIFVNMVSGNDKGFQPFLNLKGYILGNPATDRQIDVDSQVQFAYGMGLISKEIYETLEKKCGGRYQMVDASNVECTTEIYNFRVGLYGIQIEMILEDYCEMYTMQVRDKFDVKRRIIMDNTNFPFNLRHLREYSICRKEGYIVSRRWMNAKSVQEALHVRKGMIDKWMRCKYNYNYSYEVSSSVPYHVKLSARGFRSLIYSGDHDMIVPFIGTQAWIKSLNYSIVDDWRRWVVDGQIAGFARTYANRMTFATVKGAGHTAPEYRPKQCFAMFKRWIHGDAL